MPDAEAPARQFRDAPRLARPLEGAHTGVKIRAL